MSDARPDRPGPVILERLARVLGGLGVTRFALTGGVGLGVWTRPRATTDIDICAILPAAAVMPLLARHDGLRTGAEELPDMVRFRIGDWDVDLFVAKDAYDLECLDRASALTIDGVPVWVVSPEDLIIHKLIKLRLDRRRILQDVADLRSLLEAQPQMDRSYLARWLPPAEYALVQALSTLDDEAVLSRLLGRG